MAKITLKRLISLAPFAIVSLGIMALFSKLLITMFANYSHREMLEILGDSYILYIIKFNLWQALISTILTLSLAIPIARGLHRRTKFFGRKTLLNIMNISFTLPTMALILGIIMLHNKHGWINNFLQFIFNHNLGHYLYGIFGVVIAQLSFCLPLSTKLLLNDLETIPNETWQHSNQLNLSAYKIFKYIEWPAIRNTSASLGILIFMLCFTSFIIILSLGGGPAVNSLETLIYKAIKLDFSLQQASLLSIIQFSICIILLFFAYKFNLQLVSYPRKNLIKSERFGCSEFCQIFTDMFFLIIFFIISILPIIAVIYSGFNEKIISILYSDKFFSCLKQSIMLATYSSLLTVIMALSLVSGAFYLQYNLNKPNLTKVMLLLSNARILMPTFVFATGLFLSFSDFTYTMKHIFYFLILMNSIAALPFATNILWAKSLSFTNNEINLCRNLNISYLNFIKKIYYPKIRRSLGYALSFSMALSWGDLGIISLFSSKDLNTLPHLLYTLLSNYRLEEASMISLIMISFSFFFFWIMDEFWTGGNHARA